MASPKNTFEANTFGANTFACGAFRGLGVPIVFALYVVVAGQSYVDGAVESQSEPGQ